MAHHSTHPPTPSANSALPPAFEAFRLDTFVAHPGNELALRAAKAILEWREVPSAPNALFLHGASGVGKTHLAVAAARALAERCPGTRILYRTTEVVFEELTRALRSRSVSEFRQSYGQADILILDHLDQLEAMQRTQEELAIVLDAWLREGKVVLLVGAKPLSAMSALHDRLRTRLGSGLVVELTRPDFPARVEILQRHQAQTALGSRPRLGEEAIRALAAQDHADVRSLIGAWHLAMLHASEPESPTQPRQDRH